MKKRLYTLLIIICLISTLAGGAFLFHRYLNQDVIQIDEPVHIKSGNIVKGPLLHPGESIQYKLKINIDFERKICVNVSFDNVTEVLGESIYCSIRFEEIESDSLLIKEATASNPLSLTQTMNELYNTFYIIFYMPDWVGNEMKNQNFDFLINIFAKAVE